MTEGECSRTQRANVSILVATVSLLAWLCGNAYEEIALVPNLAFGGARAAVTAFRVLFHLTNPVAFYALVGPAVVVTAVVNVVQSWGEARARVLAVRAAMCVLLALLLTAWVVVRINFVLFLGPIPGAAVDVQSLGREWLALNALRMCLAGAALAFVLRLRRA